MKHNKLSSILFALALAVGLIACGDDSVNSNTDLDPNRDSTTGPNLSDQYFMVPAGSITIQANITESVPAKVFLYSKKTGEPVAQQKVSYEILESEVDQASLSAKNGTTTDDGSAAVDVRVGGQAGSIKVRANHPSANAVDFTIEVLPLEVGTLKVNLVNTAPSILDLYDIDVRVYKASEITCDEFRPFFAQQDPLYIGNAGTVNESVEFENMGTLGQYVVTGLARGERNQIAGAACMDGVTIQKDIVNDLELLLQLIPLNPVGTYDATSNWDFTQAIGDSGAVGATIIRVFNLFENPGQAIYDEIINLVGVLVGGIISGAIDTFLSITNLDDQFKDLINNFIANNDALSKVFQAGRDLRDVIANLEVHSELTIGKLSSSYEFRGTDNWLGITLYWRWNCDETSPPECGAIDIVADGNGELGNLGVLSSEWNGRVVAYNQLQIDTHPLTLRYGRLIIYVLNEVILPALTNGNANSLTDAFSYWIGCADLATSIVGSDGEACALGACIYDYQIEGFCSTAINTIFGFASLLIDNLEFDIGLKLGGEATLIEMDSDGFVDLIEEGTFDGFLQNEEGGMRSSSFNATWSAIRRDFETNNL